jgi:putative transposase
MQINYWQTLEEGEYYHIYNRSNGKVPIFKNLEDADDFLHRWSNLVAPYCETLAYCLMTNHFHFIICFKNVDNTLKEQIKAENTVAAQDYLGDKTTFNDFIVAQIGRLQLGFSKYFNVKYEREGNLFQKKFKRIHLNTIEKIVDKICYVHHNPIHHDAVSFYDAWKYSSFSAFLRHKPTKIAIKSVYSCTNQLLRSIDLNRITNKPMETGILEFPESANSNVLHFLSLHALFHIEWLKNRILEGDDNC